MSLPPRSRRPVQILMTAILSPPTSNTTPLLLYNTSWQMYEQLLDVFADYPALRLTYYQGTLELMTPLPEHETYAWTIGRLLAILSEELGLEIRGLGTTTWRSETSATGKQADQCFYIQNEAKVRHQLNIDLASDPPPDLAVEVDLSHSSLNKLNIYQALQVPELWRIHRGKIEIYHLSPIGYQQAKQSQAFGDFPVQKLASFLLPNPQLGENARMRQFREWVRQQIANQSRS